MAKLLPHSSLIDAIPLARAALRWRPWVAVALLLLPAAVLGTAIVGAAQFVGAAAVLRAVALAALLAVLAAGYVAAITAIGFHRLAELVQLLGEHGGGPVFVKDAGRRYRYANAAAAALIGRGVADVLGQRDAELGPAAAAAVFEENDRACLQRDLPTLFRETQQTPSGERVFLVGKHPLHDLRGRVSGLLGVAHDITDGLELQRVTRRRSDEKRVWLERNPLPALVFAAGDGRVLDVNTAAQRCYGYTRDAFLQLHLADVFASEEAQRLQAYLGPASRAVPPGDVAWTHRRADGAAFPVLADIVNLPHAATPSRVMLVRDRSAERSAAAALQALQTRYADVLDSGLVLTWTHAVDGRLLSVNAALADALGLDATSLAGRMFSDFVAGDDGADWDDYIGRTRSVDRDGGLLHVVARNGERRVWRYQFVRYPHAQPVPCVSGIAQDVTVQQRLESRLRDHGRRDPLTGCQTRHFLDAFAVQANVDQVWGCVLVDIDCFRQLNDSEGRARGDAVLRDLARLLASCAGPEATVVRMGGDEFAVIVPQTTPTAVQELAGRLLAVSRNGMPAVFSVGWAVREAGEPVQSTLRRADKALLRSRVRAAPR
ncbi:MAG TPA: PAS domain-containing protein [Rhodanobacteraceae bacterium]